MKKRRIRGALLLHGSGPLTLSTEWAGPEPRGITPRERAGAGHYPMVGMTKLESVCSSSLSGQRAVIVLTLVQNFTPSMPC